MLQEEDRLAAANTDEALARLIGSADTSNDALLAKELGGTEKIDTTKDAIIAQQLYHDLVKGSSSNDAKVAEELYKAQLKDTSASNERLARSLAGGSRPDTSEDERLARSLAGGDSQGMNTADDEAYARSLAGGSRDTSEDERLARSLAGGSSQGMNTADDEKFARSLAGGSSQGMNTADDEKFARSLAGGSSQRLDTSKDAEIARKVYQAQENEGGSAAGGKSSADAIAKVIEENAKRAKRAEQREQPPPPRGGLGGLAHHRDNVHAEAVEQPAFKTVDELLQRSLPRGMRPDDMIREIKQQISRTDLLRSPVKLKHEAQQGALAVLNSPPHLHVRCPKSGNEFSRVMVAVYNVIRSHKDKDELIRRLAEEIHEGNGECPTGRLGRLVNALRGFVDVGGQDVQQVLSLTPIHFTTGCICYWTKNGCC